MLSSLTQLKAAILPAAMRSRTDFDTPLTTIAEAVQGLFEGHCGRKFGYAASETSRVPGADCLSVSVARYPLVSVTSVSLASSNGEDVSDITADIVRTDKAAGLIHFDSKPGEWRDEFVIVSTGGYYVDTSEDQSGSLPSGATALPAVLRSAYYLQCKAMAEAQGILNTGAAGDDAKKKRASGELLPEVKETLREFRRMM